MSETTMVQELQFRLPETFKLEFPDPWNWNFESLLEVIEHGVRHMLDAVSVSNWEHAFNSIYAIHKMLLDPICEHIDSALSQCAQGKQLAELMARGLLIAVLQLTRSQNMTNGTAHTESFARFALEGTTHNNKNPSQSLILAISLTSNSKLQNILVKEIAICLSSALLPEFLWVLDESLQLLPFAFMGSSVTRHFHLNTDFFDDFSNELQQATLDYVDAYCANTSYLKLGKCTDHNISLWSEEKLQYITSALSVQPVSPLSVENGAEVLPWQVVPLLISSYISTTYYKFLPYSS